MRTPARVAAAVFVILSVHGAAQAIDARGDFPAAAARIRDRDVPNLARLRSGMTETPPVPGGLGAGTIYKQGALQITSRAELFTRMIVYPDGINVPNWIFTTATNRTEKAIEVVGIYIGTGASLALFDWSCMPGYPCADGSTGPAWQWTKDLTALSCYYAVHDDGGGPLHDLLAFQKRTSRRGGGAAPPPPVAHLHNSVLP